MFSIINDYSVKKANFQYKIKCSVDYSVVQYLNEKFR